MPPFRISQYQFDADVAAAEERGRQSTLATAAAEGRAAGAAQVRAEALAGHARQSPSSGAITDSADARAHVAHVAAANAEQKKTGRIGFKLRAHMDAAKASGRNISPAVASHELTQGGDPDFQD